MRAGRGLGSGSRGRDVGSSGARGRFLGEGCGDARLGLGVPGGGGAVKV